MKDLRISIITPSFNQGHYIEQTIDSVLSQKYADLEYIVIDGGSTDQTVEIIKKYERHLKYWVSEKDAGQTDAINKGLMHCSGDVVNWLNSDDFYAPDALKLVNENFMNNDVDVLLGRSNIFSSQHSRISKGGHVYSSIERTIGDALIDQPAAFFSRDKFMKFYPLDVSLRYLMDRALWIKYLLTFGHSNVLKIPHTLVNFRMHESSKTVSEYSGFNLERNAIYRSLAAHFLDKPTTLVFLPEEVKSDVQIDWNGIIPICNVERVIEEFVALLYKEAYATNEFDSARNIGKILNFAKLSSETQREVAEIRRKLTFIPDSLLKWMKGRRS